MADTFEVMEDEFNFERIKISSFLIRWVSSKTTKGRRWSNGFSYDMVET